MPNFRLRLPSRNWMIFLSITGSFTAAIMYDRRQKKLAQKKWCTLVSHIVQETLPTDRMRRKITIYLAPPPGDSLSISRGYFKEYVKPVLVAAAMDYEVIEGRREGDVRAKLAEKIRKVRRARGEPSTVVEELDNDETVALAIAESRQRQGLLDEDTVKGDLVIGRNTWKEYIRGLHEGWLGPLDPPPPPEPEPSPELIADAPTASDPLPPSSDEDTSSPTTATTETPPETLPPPTEEKPKPKVQLPPYISPAAYTTTPISPSTPPSFDPSLPLPFPHILGFLNTPTRVYRYLTQRHLADSIGREVAAIVLATQSRPYAASESFTSSIDPDDLSPASPSATPFQDPESKESSVNQSATSGDILVSVGQSYEQSSLLSAEELEWPKRIRQPKIPHPAGEEHVWLDSVVLDPRIAERMSRFEIDPAEEERARRIAEGKEGVGGGPPEVTKPWWETVAGKLGIGAEDKRNKVVLGNLEGEDGE
jgi:mitochondrial import inner membrane translocase subunit TIM54